MSLFSKKVECSFNLPFQCDELPKVISLMIVNVAFLTHYLIGLPNWIMLKLDSKYCIRFISKMITG